jgi:hypothetical protein
MASKRKPQRPSVAFRTGNRRVRAYCETMRQQHRQDGPGGAGSRGGESLCRLDQFSGKHRKCSMLGAVQFNLPIGGPDDRLADQIFHAAVIGTFITAGRTRLVRVSVDVNYVGH